MDKYSWVPDEVVADPEGTLLKRMFYWAILDARAIALRQTFHFKSLCNHRKVLNVSPAGRDIFVLERATKSLLAWLDSDQFIWYAQCLGYDWRKCSDAIRRIMNGDKESRSIIAVHLKQKARWDRWREIDAQMEQSRNVVLPMYAPPRGSQRLQARLRG